MGKTYTEITPEIASWIEQQHMFFVATAPAGADGHVNCSPKGFDSFRLLGPRRVGYLDMTGSGAETIAHLRDNGRIVFMFCAFAGPPKIVRLHGRGEVLTPRSAEWAELRAEFHDREGARTIIVADVTRVSDSCGYAVPHYDYVDERDTLVRWTRNKGADGIVDYQQQKNLHSIDGLPALDPLPTARVPGGGRE